MRFLFGLIQIIGDFAGRRPARSNYWVSFLDPPGGGGGVSKLGPKLTTAKPGERGNGSGGTGGAPGHLP